MLPTDHEIVLEHMTWEQAHAAAAASKVLIVPVGSIEQHGPHMPLGADAIVAFELGCRVARQTGSIVAPALYYAARSSPRSGGGGRSFAGSAGVTGRTLIELVKDITDEFGRTGFGRLAYLNGHYENTTLIYDALAEVADQNPVAGKTILVNWWEQIEPADLVHIFGDRFPGWEAEHAGVAETTLMEELRPDLVRAHLKGEGGVARLLTYDIFPPPADAVPPTGVPWRSDLASPDIGRYLADVLTRRISQIVDREFPSFDDATAVRPAAADRVAEPTHVG